MRVSHHSGSSHSPAPTPSHSIEFDNQSATPRATPSVVSLGSGIAQHAKSLVGSFSCGMGGSSGSDENLRSPQVDNHVLPGVSFTHSGDSSSRNSGHMKQFVYHNQPKTSFHRLE